MPTICAGGFRTCFTHGLCARHMRMRIVADLDASPALEEPGVVTVLTQADVPGKATAVRIGTTSRYFQPR